MPEFYTMVGAMSGQAPHVASVRTVASQQCVIHRMR
jgi:hypothetical protein